MIKVFIGYDDREPIAYHVCVNSIIQHSSEPVSITPLALNNFTRFYRERCRDGSNQFTYSRFLIPYLMEWVGHAIYLDGDMVVNGDIAELWQQRSLWHGVQVVKHDYRTVAEKKFLGAKNENYPRKNWSSVILWNAGHYGHRRMTPEYVERQSGAYLHRFQWLADDRIGELGKEWNWLATEYPDNDDAKIVHYTLGTPCFPDYAESSMSGMWHRALTRTALPLWGG